MVEQSNSLYSQRRVSCPGETLQELLEERGISQVELAKRTGRTTKTINEIIQGKAAITPETAIKFERVLGTFVDFWIQRDSNYRTYLAYQKEHELLAKYKNWSRKFPVKEMKERGWLENCNDTVTDLTIRLLNFFGVATPEQWEEGWGNKQFSFRRSAKIETEIGPTSVWFRRGELEAEKIECKDYSELKLKDSLSQLRALTLQKNSAIFVPELKQLCAEIGIAVVFLPSSKGVPVSGVTLWLKPTRPMILLSLRYKTDDQLWFTFFHELGHILLHGKKGVCLEAGAEQSINKSIHEQEADKFAANLLIPEKALNNWLDSLQAISENEVLAFAQSIGVSPGIIVGRLQFMRKLGHNNLNNLKRRYKFEMQESKI